MNRRKRLLAALSISFVFVGVAFISTNGASADAANPRLAYAQQQVQLYCVDLVDDATNSRQRQLRADLCAMWQREVTDLSPAPTTTAPPSTTPPVTTPVPTTNPPTTTTPPITTPPPTTDPPGSPLFCAPYPSFPDANCTGWRHTGVTLHDCGGTGEGAVHLETAGAIYDGCLFHDSVVIQAANITIRRSWVQGTVYPHGTMRTSGDKPDCKGLKLIDVEVGPSSDPDRAGVGNCFSKSLLRVDVHGTASGIHVSDFNSIIDSWSHDFADTGSHGAAAGTGQDMGNHSVIAHNNLNCSRTNGAAHCSSALSLYDEPTLDDVLVQQNLFNSVSGFCAYGGNTGTNIRFLNNVFGQRYFNTCGPFGPITVFHFNTGNVWSGNKYADGRVVNP